ncbi:MAG: hypothetical protein JSS58_10395 [Proteobacteria bacterium]|nr:hypothetical protein [Pseudomonadota bacterium]
MHADDLELSVHRRRVTENRYCGAPKKQHDHSAFSSLKALAFAAFFIAGNYFLQNCLRAIGMPDRGCYVDDSGLLPMR